jgi:hypothetical protein
MSAVHPIARAPARPARLVAEQAVVAGGQLAAGVGNLVFSLVAARVLAPGAFAQLAAFLGLYLVIHVPAASLSAGSALDPRVAAATRRRVFTLGCSAGLVLAAAALPLARLLDVPVTLLLAAAASAPTAGLIALDRGRLYGLGRHSRAVGSLLAEPAVRLGLGVALAAVAGPAGAALGVVAAGWAALAVAHLPGTRPRRAAPPRAGGATVAAFLLLAVIQNQDVLAANALLGGGEAGRFAVLSTLGGVAAFATTTVPLLLLGRRGGRGALPAALAVAAALGLGAVAFIALSPEALVRAVFGDRYAGVAGLAVPYVLAMALLGVARVLVAHAVTTRPPRTIVTVLGAATALHLVLIVALGHDAAGVATATLIATTALAAGAAAAALPHVGAPRDAANPRVAALREHVAAAARTRELWLVAGLTLAGLVLRLIVTRGIWLDEATSVWQAEMPLGRMLHTLETTDVHPPLHHLVLWVTIRVLGTGELAIRLPSLLAATAMVPLIYAAARDIYDRRAGLAAGAFTVVAPFAVWYAQEARMYAFFMLFALLAAWLQVRILRGEDGTRAKLAYTAAAAALIYTQYFGIFLVGVQLVAFLAVKKRAWLPYAALLALAIAPALIFGEHQFAANEAAGKGFEQVPSQTGGAVSAAGDKPGAYAALTNAVWAVLGYHSDATMERLAALWPLLMLLTLALLGRGRSRATALIAASAALPAAALFALGQLKPFVFEVRYFIGAVPLVLILLARAATSWSPRRSTRALAVGVTLAVLGAGVVDQQFNGSNPRVYDFRGSLQAIKADARPGDTLLYSPQYLNHVVGYYGAGIRSRPLTGDLPHLRRGRHLYLLGSFLDKPAYRDATAKAVKRLKRRYRLVSTSRRPQIRIWEFTTR